METVILCGDVSCVLPWSGLFYSRLSFFLSADPELTEIGIQQARMVHENYVSETKFGLPAPHVRFCSPLTRALQTTSIIFDEDGGIFDKYPSSVIVKEVKNEGHAIVLFLFDYSF